MGKGSKFVIIGLLILLSVSIFFLLQLFQERQSLQQGYNDIKEKLNSQTSSLSAQASGFKEEKERLQSRVSQLEKDLSGLKAERGGLQLKFDTLTKEKEELIDKLQTMASAKKETPVAIQQTAATTVGESDEYWAGVLKSKADIELQLSDLKSVVADLQLRLDEVSREKNDLTLELSKLDQESKEFSRQATYNERLAASLSTDLLREQKDKKALEDQLTAIKQENILLRASIKELDKVNFAIKNKLKSIEEQRVELDERVEQMNVSLEQKINEVAKATKEIRSLPGSDMAKVASIEPETGSQGTAQNVELPPIVVKGQDVNAVNNLKIISGKVIALNEQSNFAVINLGENHGIGIGRKFDVYHNNVKIARIEVVQTRKNISAADIVNQDPKRKIKIGDAVR